MFELFLLFVFWGHSNELGSALETSLRPVARPQRVQNSRICISDNDRIIKILLVF